MDSNVLHWLFQFNDYMVQGHCKDIDHEKSLLVHGAGGNCMNYVLGHILLTRESIIEIAIGNWSMPEAGVSLYAAHQDSIDRTKLLPFEQLVALWIESQHQLMESLSKLTEVRMHEMIPDSPPFRKPDQRGRALHFYHFHETYHVGQLGLLRREAGLPGMI